MDIFHILLSALHIGSSILWVGITLPMVGFLAPAVDLARPEGQAFLKALQRRIRWITLMGWAALTSISISTYLYLHHADMFRTLWVQTPAGLMFSLSEVAGLAAAVIATTMALPSSRHLRQIGATITAENRSHNPALLHEAERLQEQLGNGMIWSAALLSVSVVCMFLSSYVRV